MRTPHAWSDLPLAVQSRYAKLQAAVCAAMSVVSAAEQC
jgi:hypothetical protein